MRVALLALLFALSASVATASTTLDRTIRPAAGTGYVPLVAKPGERYVVRGHAKARRAKTRRSLAFFAQLTDPQIADEMSPARVDFIDPAGGEVSARWWSAEALGLDVLHRTVHAVNADPSRPAAQSNARRARLQPALTTRGRTSDT